MTQADNQQNDDSQGTRKVLAVGAHPDDVEFFCGGTLALMRKKGWRLFIASLTPGDLGSAEMSREETAQTRIAEANGGATYLGASYRCLGVDDLCVAFDDQTTRRVTACIRAAAPDLVITHPPGDYHPDHQQTSRLVHKACFAASIPNYITDVRWGSDQPTGSIPHLYYGDLMGGRDFYGTTAVRTQVVDIGDIIETKAEALARHASQREWLRAQHGIDHYLNQMRDWDRACGESVGFSYGEGFRQHLANPFPTDDLLGTVLSPLVWRAGP